MSEGPSPLGTRGWLLAGGAALFAPFWAFAYLGKEEPLKALAALGIFFMSVAIMGWARRGNDD